MRMGPNSITDLVLGLLLVLGFWSGLVFFNYIYLRSKLETLAKESHQEKPVSLYYSALGRVLVSLFVTFFILLFLLLIPGLNLLLILLAAVVGFCGWVVLGIQAYTQRSQYRKFLVAHPLPNLQMWMQDMYLAVFFFGICMALLFGFKRNVSAEPEIVYLWSLYLILAQGFSFYSAMDVCRRSVALKEPVYRAWFLLSILLYGTFLLIPAWMAWRAWRRALWQAALVRRSRSMLLTEVMARESRKRTT